MIRNQPEVRQSVHKYDDEPKKPRIPRSNVGNATKRPPSPETEALMQSAPPYANNDHQGYPMDTYDGKFEVGCRGGHERQISRETYLGWVITAGLRGRLCWCLNAFSFFFFPHDEILYMQTSLTTSRH